MILPPERRRTSAFAAMLSTNDTRLDYWLHSIEYWTARLQESREAGDPPETRRRIAQNLTTSTLILVESFATGAFKP